MDQALIQGTFAGLYEKLVADVAARVVATMAEKPVFVCDAEMRAIAVAVFEERIDGALGNYDCSDAVDAAIDALDIISKVQEAVDDLDISSKVEEAIEDIDWDEKIKEAFCGLRVELVPR
jgi:hypothetical protein